MVYLQTKAFEGLMLASDLSYLIVILDDIVDDLVTATVAFPHMLIIMRNPSFPEISVKPSDNVLRGFAGVPSGVSVLWELESM